MTKKEINNYLDQINDSLQQRRIKQAIDILNSLVLNLQNWQYREKLFDLDENYKRMLSYITQGFHDPERERILNDLIRSLYLIKDEVALDIKTKTDTAYFYERRRSYQANYPESPSELITLLHDIDGKIELISLLDDEKNNQELINWEKQKDAIVEKIFLSVWLGTLWNKDVKEAWLKVIHNNSGSHTVASLLISGSVLSLMETFDEQKALFLLELANNPDEEIKQRAITGILLFLRKYDNRLFLFPSIQSRLKLLEEDKVFTKSVRNIIIQFIQSMDTEKISRKITEELIPKMMKMGPKLHDKLRIDDLTKDAGIEDKNPDWEKIIKNEGLENDFQEITELQMEGADVMHSSFAHLKNYPFFYDISNWFIPFKRPVQAMENKDLQGFTELLIKSTMICNSDKYSFFFSIMQMPDSYRKMMMSQFSAESEALQEAVNSETKKENYIIRQYIQDLYRFYKLFPKKESFEDIFKANAFYRVDSIMEIIKNTSDRYLIGEYYFKKNYFLNASEIFQALLEEDPNNDVLYQKLGYCYQMMGDLEKAIEIYSKAELLNANNSWLIRKMAYCYRLLKQPEQALIYYKKAEKQNADNLSIQLNIGHCLLELKNYDEAIKSYFKVEYLETEKNKPKAWRPIAWTLFLIGKYNQAQDYFDKIIAANPNATDFLNAGHNCLAMGNRQQAILLYARSIKQSDNTIEKFMEAFQADIPDLIQAGVTKTDLPFILDSILYEL